MKEITTKELETYKTEGKKLLVQFKAKWCTPCKLLVPRLEELNKDYSNIEFFMVDVDDNRDDVIKLGLRSVPQVMVFDGENLIGKINGVKPDQDYKDLLDKL